MSGAATGLRGHAFQRVLFVLALMLASATASSVWAHAVLLEATPSDGAVLESSPSHAVLRFNEPVSPVRVRLLDADARLRVDGSHVEAVNDTVRLPLPSALARGTYVLTYRVLSADSHPVAGSVVFSVGAVSATPTETSRAGEREQGWTTAVALARALFAATVMLAAGGVLALGLLTAFDAVSVVRNQGLIHWSACLAILSGLALLGLKGAQLADAPVAGLLDPATWRIGALSSLGGSVAVAVVGLVGVMAMLPRSDRQTLRNGAIVASIAALGSFSLTGHAATASPRMLASAAVAVHVFCAAFWLGALGPLRNVLRSEPSPLAAFILQRFSTIALVTVALLIAAGAALAVLQVGQWVMLWQSTYGLVLCAKFLLVILLLAVAAVNRFVLMPRLANDAGVAISLMRTIAVEYALFAGVIVLTGFLSQIEPPRAAIARADYAKMRAPFSASATDAGHIITLTVTPGQRGPNTIAVAVTRADGTPLAPREVTIAMSLPAAGIEAISRSAARDAAGRFVYQGNDLLSAGVWRIGLRVLVDDFTLLTAEYDVPVR